MAKLTMITLYDDHSTGVRIMSNVLRKRGHESNIIFFKISMNRVIPYDKEKPLESIILHDGKLMTWCPSGAPWSQKEIDLLIRQIDRQSPDIIGFSYRSIFDKDIGSLRMQIRKRFSQRLHSKNVHKNRSNPVGVQIRMPVPQQRLQPLKNQFSLPQHKLYANASRRP